VVTKDPGAAFGGDSSAELPELASGSEPACGLATTAPELASSLVEAVVFARVDLLPVLPGSSMVHTTPQPTDACIPACSADPIVDFIAGTVAQPQAPGFSISGRSSDSVDSHQGHIYKTISVSQKFILMAP
jgi:hypothetical protein